MQARMQARHFGLTIATALAAATFMLPSGGACAQSADALVGQVNSPQEGAMEGVVVSARKAGSIVTVSVLTDHEGRYRFPAARLAPGSYALAIRAAGYDLDGTATAEVEAGKAATADLRLKPTKNLPTQLTNAEWLASMPGSDNQKKAVLNCIGCHDVDRIVRSTHGRVHAGVRAHGWLLSGRHAGAPAAPRRRGAAQHRSGARVARVRRVSGVGQSVD